MIYALPVQYMHDSLVKVLGPGKTRTHCGGNIVSCDVARPWQNEATLLRAARTQEMFLKTPETFFVSRTQTLCRTQMLRAWQNEDTFGKHDHVSNVAATMCPRFASPLQTNRGPMAAAWAIHLLIEVSGLVRHNRKTVHTHSIS